MASPSHLPLRPVSWNGPHPHQHHRHPRPCGLHHRSRAVALRVLDGAVAYLLRCGRRGAPVRDRLAPGRQGTASVPRIAFVNKMDRVGADFGRVVEMIRDRHRRQRRSRSRFRSAPRISSRASSTCIDREGAHLGRREPRLQRIPRRRHSGIELREQAAERSARSDLVEAVPPTSTKISWPKPISTAINPLPSEAAAQGPAHRHPGPRSRPGALRQRIQEQGRPAAARRRDRLSAFAPGRPAGRGHASR